MSRYSIVGSRGSRLTQSFWLVPDDQRKQSECFFLMTPELQYIEKSRPHPRQHHGPCLVSCRGGGVRPRILYLYRAHRVSMIMKLLALILRSEWCPGVSSISLHTSCSFFDPSLLTNSPRRSPNSPILADLLEAYLLQFVIVIDSVKRP